MRDQNLTANHALACLFDLGDPRAPGLLARDFPHRAELLASGEFLQPSGPGPLLAFDQHLLDAIRGVLSTGEANADGLLPGRPVHLRRNALIRILDLLASWGPLAAPAAPEVRTLPPHHAVGVARTLAAIAAPGTEAIEALRAAAGPDARHASGRLMAASALRDLAGDTGPLLAAIKDCLARSHDLSGAARAARSIEDPPAWLAPALQAALADSSNDQRTRAEAARTLSRLAAGTDAVLPVMAELLRQSPYGPGGPVGGYAALEAACALGPAAGPLIPELARFLDAPVFCPLAAEAILHAGLDSLSMSALADHLVTAAGAGGGHNHKRALDLLREIRHLDQAAISPGMLGRLRDLAERPARVICSGTYVGIIRQDEALRRMISGFLQETA